MGKKDERREIMMTQSNIIKLFEANKGDSIRITHLDIDGVMRRRLLDLGFVPELLSKYLEKVLWVILLLFE